MEFKYFVVYNYTKGIDHGTDTGQFVGNKKIESIEDINIIELEIKNNQNYNTVRIVNYVLMDSYVNNSMG